MSATGPISWAPSSPWLCERASLAMKPRDRRVGLRASIVTIRASGYWRLTDAEFTEQKGDLKPGAALRATCGQI